MANKFFPPKATTATRSIATPLDGELLYDENEQLLYYGDGATVGGVAVGVDPFPSQAGEAGKYLSTNGTVVGWATVDALPAQAGQTGKVLTTDGSVASWIDPSGGGHTIQEEGTPLTQRTNLNFVGSTVTVTDDAGNDASVVTIATPPTINWLGAWSGATNYVVDDAVSYLGSSYIANASSLNKIPGTDPEWDLLASKGDTGAAGATGSVSSASSLTLTHIATPAAPAAGNTIIYGKSDGKIYKCPAGGAETEVGAGANAYSDLTDVDTTGIAVGQTMVWNGAVWIPGSASGGREVLTANRTYYVRTDGNDSNDGLADTAGGAFLTIQKAINVATELDLNIYNIIISISTDIAESFVCYPQTGGGEIIIQSTSESAIKTLTGEANKLITTVLGKYRFKNIKFTTPWIGLGCESGGIALIDVGVDFGACTIYQIYCFGGLVGIVGNYTISGASGSHYFARAGGIVSNTYLGVNYNSIVTITGTPAITTFARVLDLGYLQFNSGASFSGGTIGKKYDVIRNAVIYVDNQGTNYFPGSIAGTVATGGQYI